MGKTIFKIIITVLIIGGILWLLDYFVLLERVKRPINEVVNNAKPVNTECRRDSDCVMAPIDCSPCQEKGAAVNAGYSTFCPLRYKQYEAICSGRERQWRTFQARCEEGQCVAVYPNGS